MATTVCLFTTCGSNNANSGSDSQQDATTESATASTSKTNKVQKYNAKCFEDLA